MIDEPADGVPRFDLFTRDGQPRLVWRLIDHGVALEDDALVVRRAGRWTRLPFDRIAGVTLNTAGAGRSAPLAQCTIRASSGASILVSNSNDRGLADPMRNRDFRDFVVGFHQRLVGTGAARSINFASGFSQARITGLTVALIAGGALFVVLPLVLLLITGEVKVLFALIAGAALLWPSIRIAQNNQPGIYLPTQPPDLTG